MLIQYRLFNGEGHEKWIAIQLDNDSSVSIWIAAINIYDGMICDFGGIETEMDKIKGTEIEPGGFYTINACDRKNVLTGTRGTVTLRQKSGNNPNMIIRWDCPVNDSNYLGWGGKLEGLTVHVPKVEVEGAMRKVTVIFSNA